MRERNSIMKKGKSVVVIVLALVLTALCLFTAFVGWGKGGTGAIRNIKTGLDLAGGVSITYETDEAMPSASDMSDTIQKLQHRVDQYSTESNVYQEGANRINIEIPGVTNADEILEDLGSPGTLYFISQTDSEGNANYEVSSTTGVYELTDTIENLEAKGAIVCSGADVDDAQGGIINENNTGNKYVVDLKFKASGTQKFADFRHSRFILVIVQCRTVFFGIHSHTAKLINIERPSKAADAFLFKDGGTSVLAFHRNIASQHQR